MENNIKIIAMTGSLRRNSYNKSALAAAKDMLPEGVEFEMLDLSELPFFSEDVEAEIIPQSVAAFKEKLKSANALLISYQYNYSIPPVLKNALDWASRGDEKPLWGKTAAIMSASPSILGGARVQYHLRQVCTSLNIEVLNKPEVFIASAHTKFDTEGKLTDERTRQAIAGLISALLEKIKS